MHDKHSVSYRPLTLFDLVGSGPTDIATNRAAIAAKKGKNLSFQL